jgi:pyrophosphatase PpaX
VVDCRVISVPRAVLFDLDGTLLDSIPLILDSYAHTFARFGLPIPPRESLIADIGRPLTIVLGRVARDRDHLAEMVAVYRGYNLTHHDARAVPFPGVVAMVHAVRARGLGTAVVTSKIRDSAERGVRVLGLEGAVDCIVGSDDVAEPKPAAEPVIKAARLLGAHPREAIMVGDSAHDMASGRAAGARTAAAGWGVENDAALRASAPDHWLEKPRDLRRLLDSATFR